MNDSTLTVHLHGVAMFRLKVPLSWLVLRPAVPAPCSVTPASVVCEALPYPTTLILNDPVFVGV